MTPVHSMYWTVKVDGGPKRVNHAAVALGGDIYSFGGYCSGELYDGNQPIDVHVLDTETFRWRKVAVQYDDVMDTEGTASLLHSAPYQRYGHTVVEYDGRAYLWGGRNDEYGASSKMHVFDPETRSWTVVGEGGGTPPARDGHSAVVVGDIMYMFGGFEEESQRFSRETYAFNFKTEQWSEMRTSGQIPQWRDFHTACAIGSQMFVFGGRSDQMGQFHSSRDVYCDRLKVLDLTTGQWSEPNVKGDRPCGRRSHSAWAHNGRMFTFGGYLGTENRHLGDLWEYDPSTMRWRSLSPFGCGPSPRRRQCTVLVGHRLFLFGGTMPSKAVKQDPSHSGLSDLSDLYVLDYSPSLKSLSSMAVLKYRLDESYGYLLPRETRLELRMMTQPNKITSPRHEG